MVVCSNIEFSDSSAYRGKIQAETDDSLTFYTGGVTSEKVRITSGGNFGLGETSPDFKFHSKETGGSSIAGLFETNQTDAFISFQASGTTASSTVRIGAVGDDFRAFINGAERLPHNLTAIYKDQRVYHKKSALLYLQYPQLPVDHLLRQLTDRHMLLLKSHKALHIRLVVISLFMMEQLLRPLKNLQLQQEVC